MKGKSIKTRLLAALLAAALLLGLPLPGLAAGGAGGKAPALEWTWSTKISYGGAGQINTGIRNDECPELDSWGYAYLTPEDGYLYCVGPDGVMRWRVFLNQAGDYGKTGGKRPVFDAAGNCYIGSGDGSLYAVSPAGQVLWTFKMDEKISTGTSPALSPDGKTVYAATQTFCLHAVDTATGAEKWHYMFGGSWNSNTPVVAPDGAIYVGSDRTLNAANPDGSLKWRRSFDNYVVHRMIGGFGNAAWEGDHRMAAGPDGALYAVVTDKARGNRQYDNTLLALNGADGSERWHLDVNQRLSAPAVRGDTLYYKTGDNTLHALDTATGAEKWAYKAEGELYYNDVYLYDNAPLAEPDGTVVVPMGNRLYTVRDEGDRAMLLWKTADHGFAMNPPSGCGPGGELYCTGMDRYYPYLLKFTDQDYAPVPAELSISEGDFALLSGGVYTIQPRIVDTYGRQVSRAELAWESSNPAAVAVDRDGLVTARAPGQARITVRGAEYPEVTAAVSVTVLSGTAGLTLQVTPAEGQVEAGRVLTLGADLLGSGNVKVLGEVLKWESADSSIAAVDQTGAVTGLQAGTAKIRAWLQRQQDIGGEMSLTVTTPAVQQVTPAQIRSALDETIAWFIKDQGLPGDWAAFGLNAAGEDITVAPYVDGSGRNYLDKLEEKIAASGVGALMTDYERTVLGVVSAGGDPRDVAGVDLIERIVSWSGMGQGINAAVWGLIALDAANAPDPAEAGRHTRNEFITYILNNKAGAGWAYGGGSTPDPDMTGMALYALTPYRTRADVQEAGEKAIAWLSRNQADDGRFGSWGSINSESCSQVIMGITSWGIDPQGPEFTKAYGNAVTGLLSFQTSSGVFRHTTMEDPGMATDQAIEALAALECYYDTGVNTIFYKIQAVGSPDLGEITILEVYPDGLVLEPGQTVAVTAKNQGGLTVPGQLVNWSVSDGSKAQITVDEAGDAAVTALAPGEVYITVALKDNGSVTDQGQVTVVNPNEFQVAARQPDAAEAAANPGKYIGVEVTNISGVKKQAVVIISFYRLDTMETVHQTFVSREFAPGETAVVWGYYPAGAAEAGQYGAKAMVWDGWYRARALTGAIEEK